MVAAAASLFAENGYGGTTMGAIAERAGTSTGNLYKYFGSKEELLDAVLPPAFAKDLENRTRQRIRALGTARDVNSLAPDSAYHLLAGALLEHCVAHRDQVVFLLRRAEGTPFADFPARFVRNLVSWALGYARDAWPCFRPTRTARLVLHRVYANYVGALADALHTVRDPEEVREALELLSTYHLGGLEHVFETNGATP